MTYVDCVNVSPKLITLKVGTWFYGASAQTCPCDANCNCVTWSSNNTSVAIVNETSGYVYAKSAGTAIICAMANDGSGKCDYMTVVVKEKVLVESINLNWSNITVEKNKEITLEANVLPMEADSRDVVWSCDNVSVAEVSCDGVVTTKSGGMATITATSVDGSNVKGLCNIVVTDNKLVNEIKITPSTLRMALSQTVHLSEEVYPEDATIKSVNWSSSNDSIVSVNPDTGLVIPHNIGTVTITATANDNSGVYSTCSVEIYAIPIDSIEMFIKTKTMKPGEETVFTTKICPVNANYKSLRWQSSNPRVAEVDYMTGKVTALKDGTVTITAKDMSSDTTASVTITVDSREKVIIEKDSDDNYNKIVFESGKIWKCINSDIINDYDLNVKEDTLSRRFYENVYETIAIDEFKQVYFENLKEYTDEEIKLIYTIDPHGLAAYVKEYGNILFRTKDSVQEMLKVELDYKDNIFFLLFNRHPDYYARTINGEWYKTSDRSELLKVMSESEFLFGRHVIYDMFTLREFISVAIDILAMATQCPAISGLKAVSVISNVLEYYSLGRSVAYSVLNGDFNGFVSSIVSGSVNEDNLNHDFITPSSYKSQNYTLGWAFELLSFGSDLGALADTFNNGPHFYKEIFTKCANDSDYNILIRTIDNQLVSISEINDVIA